MNRPFRVSGENWSNFGLFNFSIVFKWWGRIEDPRCQSNYLEGLDDPS
jgi:hypothetical protein